MRCWWRLDPPQKNSYDEDEQKAIGGEPQMGEVTAYPARQMDVDEVLQKAAVEAKTLSGRTLRKLPFLAHATYIQSSQCSQLDFARALLATIQDEQSTRSHAAGES